MGAEDERSLGSAYTTFREFADFRDETRREFVAVREDMAGAIKALTGQVQTFVDSEAGREKDDKNRRVVMLASVVGAVLLGVMETATTVAVVLSTRPHP